ncbi:cytochrome c4 [Paracoccus sp. R12_1]|uniref:c-type cytochrome n=1 Tax=unclassified Paracoccus (in: a-proteobacteria) TaxID=2688777 RepID=UPI001ADA6125|nr:MULTISPECIES: c-type cytochrome [unclassified Paracoccus (in: a-proteobacteria)]MBO9455139.1 cytochrome c4 [Paracoccus sp. R12_2]MBO9486489.1 cytochrome c4 [Paracoccus sp. R12_1]
MRGISLLLASGGIILAGAASSQDLQGDAASGRKLAGQCRTCHGLEGYARIPVAPHIGGESAEYVRGQLTAFRDGERRNEMMSVVAAALTDQQIADLAAWYSSQDATATLAADPADAPQECVSCHGADGMAVIDGAPNLAGENSTYLLAQVKAFQRGDRQSEVMQDIVSGQDDAQLRAAAEWYSAIALEIAKPQ